MMVSFAGGAISIPEGPLCPLHIVGRVLVHKSVFPEASEGRTGAGISLVIP
jgi:hypothetical protein